MAAGESAPTVVSYWYTPPVVAAGGVGVPGSQSREPLQPNPSLMSIGNRLIKYDPYTGAVGVNSITGLTLNFTGMSGTFYNDPFVLSVQTLGSGANTQYQLINWTTAPVTDNFTSRILSNVTWPFSTLGTVDYETGVAVVTASITPPAAGVAYGQRIMGASIITGKLLWNVTTDLAENTHGSFSGSTAIADHGKFAMRLNDGYWHTWDLLTGQPSWVSELSSYPWGIFGIYGVESAYGLLYYPQYDGVVAYNWTTGKIAWIYTYPAQFPYETLFGSDYAFYQATVRIADGVLYAANSEHSPTEPIARGWKIHAINATTGAGIWNLTGAMTPGAVADGYMTLSNGYDGYMYVIGRGQSATTITAPQTAQPLGTTILIQGTVTDQSLAQKGTPCVSQDSMATQMEYLHMQLPIDGVAHNISMTGVPVKLTALDPNNNVIDIGTVTTNPHYGTFSFGWKPSVEGAYTITASFAADDSYGSSSAATALLINPAPTQTVSATSIPGTAATSTEVMTYVVIVGVAIIIAIAIATVLIIRKGKL